MPIPLTSDETKGDAVVVCISGVPSVVLAAVEDGMARWLGRLEVKGEEPSVCCCCVTITADNRGELEVTGNEEEATPPPPPGRKAPLLSMPSELSPSATDEPVDMLIAPISIPPPPPDADTKPLADIHDGRPLPTKLSPPTEMDELGIEGASSIVFGLTTSTLFPWCSGNEAAEGKLGPVVTSECCCCCCGCWREGCGRGVW